MHVRHVDVEQHQFRLFVPEQAQRVGTISGLNHVIPGAAQNLRPHIAVDRVVVDVENLGHCLKRRQRNGVTR